MKAVATLLEQSNTAWLNWNFPSGIQPKITAATAARKPTTVAWTWRREAGDIIEEMTGSSINHTADIVFSID